MNHDGSGHYEQLKSQLEKQEEEIAIYKLYVILQNVFKISDIFLVKLKSNKQIRNN